MSAAEYEAIRLAKTRAAVIDEQTSDIWGYVRENRNKLDADRVCNRIRHLLEYATEKVAKEAADVIKENEKLKAKLEKKRLELKELRGSIRCQS